MNEVYEAVFIIKDYKDLEKINNIKKKIDEIIAKEYDLFNKIDYGVKKLAYEIRKEKTGYYYVIKFRDNGKKKNAISKIEKNINTMEEILKYIIIRNDD